MCTKPCIHMYMCIWMYVYHTYTHTYMCIVLKLYICICTVVSLGFYRYSSSSLSTWWTQNNVCQCFTTTTLLACLPQRCDALFDDRVYDMCPAAITYVWQHFEQVRKLDEANSNQMVIVDVPSRKRDKCFILLSPTCFWMLPRHPHTICS